MFSGSTCFGIQIMRSFNGVDFEQVGAINGLSGSISAAVDYEYVDEAPEAFRTHYYRLILGLNGPSSMQDIVVEQVLDEESIVLYPDGQSHVIVYSRLPLDAEVSLRLFQDTLKTG